MSVENFKKIIEEKIGKHKAKMVIIKSLLEYGIRINEDGYYCIGPFKLHDSSIAKALNIDRRVVRETANVIAKDQYLRKFFINLTPVCSMKNVCGILGFSALVITVENPKKSGIVSNVAGLISKYGLNIRQIFADDPELFDDPKLTIVIEGNVPGDFLSELNKNEEIKTITLFK
jgi:predicted regulator of amino acid metabolism with ACT domain